MIVLTLNMNSYSNFHFLFGDALQRNLPIVTVPLLAWAIMRTYLAVSTSVNSSNPKYFPDNPAPKFLKDCISPKLEKILFTIYDASGFDLATISATNTEVFR